MSGELFTTTEMHQEHQSVSDDEVIKRLEILNDILFEIESSVSAGDHMESERQELQDSYNTTMNEYETYLGIAETRDLIKQSLESQVA
ncbi:MAG TPA: hypothetical protein VFS65_02405 [Candidatus Saccharimonadales bacterium]|nr:hypothetical protein [Candidatus Saccharimonadales bacterium]